MWQFRILKIFTPFGRNFGEMSRKLIWQRSHCGTVGDRAAAIAHYHQHIETVKAAVPAERLLIFSVDQGWAPLCRFLGVPVPEETFPNVNDRAEVKKTIAAIVRRAYAIVGIAAAIVVIAVYALFRFGTAALG